MILAKGSLSYDHKYDRNHSFIVLATVITIVNCDCKTLIVQTAGHYQRYFRKQFGG
jgi:hypothetical protein